MLSILKRYKINIEDLYILYCHISKEEVKFNFLYFNDDEKLYNDEKTEYDILLCRKDKNGQLYELITNTAIERIDSIHKCRIEPLSPYLEKEELDLENLDFNTENKQAQKLFFIKLTQRIKSIIDRIPIDTPYEYYENKKFLNADNLVIAKISSVESKIPQNQDPCDGPYVTTSEEKYIFEVIKTKEETIYIEVLTGSVIYRKYNRDVTFLHWGQPHPTYIESFTDYFPETKGLALTKLDLIEALHKINIANHTTSKTLHKTRT